MRVSGLDLEAIERRVKAYYADVTNPVSRRVVMRQDITALIAELRRLRAGAPAAESKEK